MARSGRGGGRQRSLRHYIEITQTAERALFDFVFIADSNSTFGPDDPDIWKRNAVSMRLEPLTLLGALSAVTSHIGLIATATTTYLDPFHVARMFASLDQMSGGRVGWNVVTSRRRRRRSTSATTSTRAHAERYRARRRIHRGRAGPVGQLGGRRLHVRDKATGLFFDPAKLHMLNHKGKHFSVRGPLNVPRSPQGQPVIVQAGQSDAGRELAARTAEVLFTVQQQIEPAQRVLRRHEGAHRQCGRSPDSIKVMPGVLTVVGRTRDEARREIRAAAGADPSRARRAGAVGHRRSRPVEPFRSTGRCRSCR